MKHIGKALTALALAACMTLALASCGSGGGGGDTQELSGTVYVPEFMDLDLDLDYISGGCSDGTYIYLVGDSYTYILMDADGNKLRELTEDEVEAYQSGNYDDGSYIDYEDQYSLYRVPLEGGEGEKLEDFVSTPVPEGMEGSSYVESIRAGSDGTIWVTEEVYTYSFDLPEDFDEENDDRWNYYTSGDDSQVLRQLDSSGKELGRLDTGSIQEKLGVDYISYSLVDGSGNIYVYAEDKLTVLDGEMNALFTVEDENLYGGLMELGDGSVGICSWSEDGGQSIRTISLEDQGWGPEYALPSNVGDIYTGSEKYLFFYNNGDSLYGYNAETEEGEKLLSWVSSDINRGDLEFFTFLTDGRVVAMTRSWTDSGSKMELAVLTEQPASVLAGKTILTYATMWLDYDARSKIIDFNKTNTNYRIEIQDYSEYNTTEDESAGLTKLNTEILAGNVPDILDTDGLPLRQYGAKGILEDLWTYIDNDPDISRDDLMVNVLNAAQQDGKLYEVFSSFSIQTVVGAASVVGDRMSWTLSDLQGALAAMPEGCQIFSEGNTKGDMLSTVLYKNLDSLVDWDTGECSFNGDQFKAMLEFCDSFPLEYNWDETSWEDSESDYNRIASGKQMLETVYLYDFSSIQMYKAMFGGDVSFIGYPKEDGSVGSAFNTSSGMAISTTCKDKDAAWSFVRQQLLSQGDNLYWGDFPVNKADFDKMASDAMTPQYQYDENGNIVTDENGDPVEISQGGWGIGDDLTVEIMATSQAEYDQFMALYNAIDTITGYDEKISSIVDELATAYFNGDAGLQETVDSIQSRVTLYVNENR